MSSAFADEPKGGPKWMVWYCAKFRHYGIHSCGGKYADYSKGYWCLSGRRSVWHQTSLPHLSIPAEDYQRHWEMEGPHA